MEHIADIDIDVASSTDKNVFGVQASIYDASTKTLRPHPCGRYIDDDIPLDRISGLAAIDYKTAEEHGFQKIDILTNRVYDNFQTKDDVIKSLNTEPDWSLLCNHDFVKSLPHISDHFELVSEIAPTSVMELADILALIRPAKQHLIQEYKKNPEKTRKRLYKKTDGFMFKRSHAVAYACMLVCHINNKTNKRLLEF